MCTVKGVAHGNKSTENYQPTLRLPSYLLQQLDRGLVRLRANALVAEHTAVRTNRHPLNNLWRLQA